MALNNANNTHCIVVNLASLTADLEVPAMYCSKDLTIEGVAVQNGADIVADNTNYVKFYLKNGSDIMASFDSRASANGALVGKQGKLMTIDEAKSTALKNSSLTILYDEEGNIGLTNASITIWYKTK